MNTGGVRSRRQWCDRVPLSLVPVTSLVIPSNRADRAERSENVEVIELEQAVRSRKRVARGVWAARTMIDFSVGMLLINLRLAMPSPISDNSGLGLAVTIPAILVAVYFVDRWVKKLRYGSRFVALITIGSGTVLGVLGLMMPDSVEAFFRGIGTSVYDRSVNPFSGAPMPEQTLATAIALTPFVVGWFRVGRIASTRRRVIPAPIRTLGAWIAAYLVASLGVYWIGVVVNSLIGVGVPIAGIGLIVAVPTVLLAMRASLEVLAPPALEAGVRPWEPVRRPRRRLFTGRRGWMVLPIVGGAVVMGLIAFLLRNGSAGPVEAMLTNPATTDRTIVTAWGTASVIGSSVFFLAAIGLIGLARRMAAIDATTARERDDRPWSLYLRSFGDDDIRVHSHGSPRHTYLERAITRRSERFEVVLGWHLWRFGPLVGVGRPKERLPRLGAAREYLDDEVWHQEVEDRIGGARAVIVMLGHTDGLAWELATIERLGAISRTIVVVPPLPASEVEERWRAFSRIATDVGWPDLDLDGATHMARSVVARSDGSAWVVHVDQRDEWNYEMAIEGAFARLRSGGGSDHSTEDPAAEASGRRGRRTMAATVIGFAYLAVVFALGATGPSRLIPNLEVGDCIDLVDWIDGEPSDVNRVPLVSCDSAHDAEIVAMHSIPDATTQYPGDVAMESAMFSTCRDRVDAVGLDHPVWLEADVSAYFPNRVTWLLGDQTIACFAYRLSGPLDVPFDVFVAKAA